MATWGCPRRLMWQYPVLQQEQMCLCALLIHFYIFIVVRLHSGKTGGSRQFDSRLGVVSVRVLARPPPILNQALRSCVHVCSLSAGTQAFHCMLYCAWLCMWRIKFECKPDLSAVFVMHCQCRTQHGSQVKCYFQLAVIVWQCCRYRWMQLSNWAYRL